MEYQQHGGFRSRTHGASEETQCEFDESRSNTKVLNVDKRTVTYMGPNTANLLHGIAIASHPLSNSNPLAYFEVIILSRSQGGSNIVTIGLVPQNYNTHMEPGWVQGSYGYHGDNGRKYDGTFRGEEFGPTFGRGDVVGVGLDNLSNSVFFTKNGKYLGIAFKRTEKDDLYPCVGLCGGTGESVVANFAYPFIFDIVGAQHGGLPVNPPVEKMKVSYEDPHLDTSCHGDSLEITKKRAQVLLDASHSVIGVARCSLPFSPYLPQVFTYFEVFIEKLGTGDVSIGLSNRECPLNLHVGWLRRSYAYHSDDGCKFKWKDDQSARNDGEPYGPTFGQGDTIGCGLDTQTRGLYFTKNGEMLGVAFTNVYGILFPSVGITGPGNSVVFTFCPPFMFHNG